MKILQLNLLAFGPFTDTVLNLNEGHEGLHIIYGLNEAGKSSSLRALLQLLYGIELRTPDDFRHPYSKLRVGGTVRRDDGQMLEFIRRKKKANTLMTPDESEFIEDSLLRTFLGGVDKETFKNRFGINHARLVQGGREIVKGGGDIGQILFAGGTGISDSRKIQNDLLAQAGEFFKPSGKKQRINQAIMQFKEKQNRIQKAQLPSQEWDHHNEALNRAQEQKKTVETDLEKIYREQGRLERIQKALPAVSRRRELLGELESYADAILLPDDFSKRRREVMTNLRIAENEENQAIQSLEDISQSLRKLEVPESLIENADVIGDIYQEFGGIRKAMKDRLRLEGLRSQANAEAKEILRGLRGDLTLDQAEQLRLEKAESIKIQELGRMYERLVFQSENTQKDISKFSLRIAHLNKHLGILEELRDTSELLSVMESARQHGDMEAYYHAEMSGIRKADAAANIQLKKQTFWAGSLEDIEKLAMPSTETIDVFEHQLRKAEDAATKLHTDIDELERLLVENEGQIEQLRLEQEVPTEEDLIKARHRREHNWQIIRKSPFPLEKEMAGSYESGVRHADEVADRLRREAERVAKKAGLLAEGETRKNQCTRLKGQLEKAETEFDALGKQWCAVWKSIGISPKSPREMRTWAQKQSVLADQVSKIREQRARAGDLKTHIETYRRELIRCLNEIEDYPLPADSDETLAFMLQKSRQIVDHMAEIRSKQDRLCRELEQREDELREAEAHTEKTAQELSTWKSQWMKALETLGLDADATPAQANSVMDDLRNLFVKLKDADVLRKRIRGIDRDAEEFREKLISLAEHEAPDLAYRPMEQIAAEINTRLTRARTARAYQQSLEKQEKQEEKQLGKARSKIAEIHAILSAMCEEAGCKTYEDLPPAEERSVRRRQTEAQLTQIEAQLRNLSAGATLDEFIRDVQSVDPDTIVPTIDTLSDEINRLGEEKTEFDQTIGSERTELRKMDGGPRAAELAEEAMGILAHLESDVEQYVRLRLASTVLSQAIERYREKNHEPILKRSEELFAQMTLGSFKGLRLDFEEKGDPVLVGLRLGGRETVSVEGMSDGTADQLYLAVRLASLEAYLEKNEPMPFIVDDILIKFDDERALATLQVLAQLSEKTQVIFFTHHRHLVELAERNMDGDVLFTHSLNGRPLTLPRDC